MLMAVNIYVEDIERPIAHAYIHNGELYLFLIWGSDSNTVKINFEDESQWKQAAELFDAEFKDER